MPGDLVELARYPSSMEASLARSHLEAEGIRAELDGEGAANWLSFIGSAIGGVRILVNDNDVHRASEILKSIGSVETAPDTDFGDDSEGDEGTNSERSDLPEDLTRAWRASLIGIILFPPLLNIYSAWLLIRNHYFVDHGHSWRVPATCLVNGMVFVFSITLLITLGPSSIYQPPFTTTTVSHELVPVHPLLFVNFDNASLNDIKTILDENSSVSNQQLPQGEYPIVHAVMAKRADIVKLLLENGADPNISSHLGRPLGIAALGNDVETGRVLLEHGSDPDASDLMGRTVRQICRDDNYRDFRELLNSHENKHGEP